MLHSRCILLLAFGVAQVVGADVDQQKVGRRVKRTRVRDFDAPESLKSAQVVGEAADATNEKPVVKCADEEWGRNDPKHQTCHCPANSYVYIGAKDQDQWSKPVKLTQGSEVMCSIDAFRNLGISEDPDSGKSKVCGCCTNCKTKADREELALAEKEKLEKEKEKLIAEIDDVRKALDDEKAATANEKKEKDNLRLLAEKTEKAQAKALEDQKAATAKEKGEKDKITGELQALKKTTTATIAAVRKKLVAQSTAEKKQQGQIEDEDFAPLWKNLELLAKVVKANHISYLSSGGEEIHKMRGTLLAHIQSMRESTQQEGEEEGKFSSAVTEKLDTLEKAVNAED